MMNQKADHQPIMLSEAIEHLQIEPNHWYVDATFGRGGHTAQILNQKGKVIAFDWDEDAIKYGQEKFADQIKAGHLVLRRASFTELSQVVQSTKLEADVKIMGVLFDFGTSSDQLTSGARGFSFNSPGPLDMRMDQRLGVTAADLLAVIPENQLAQMFVEFGGEPEAKKIAKAIKNSPQPITTTEQLSELVASTKRRHSGHLHPATKVFQALRIAVNSELDEISAVLPQALEVVEPGGRIVTIAFHEGEDRLVKTAFKSWQTGEKGEMETKKPITPSEKELAQNPRSRSAKLRVFRKK